MSKTNKKAKSPVKLKSEIKHFHQLSFLEFINELAPEVSKALKKLTPKCQELFGKMPVAKSDSEHGQNDISTPLIVSSFFWEDSVKYDPFFEFNVLEKYGEKLKSSFESSSKSNEAYKKIIDSKLDKAFDSWKQSSDFIKRFISGL